MVRKQHNHSACSTACALLLPGLVGVNCSSCAPPMARLQVPRRRPAGAAGLCQGDQRQDRAHGGAALEGGWCHDRGVCRRGAARAAIELSLALSAERKTPGAVACRPTALLPACFASCSSRDLTQTTLCVRAVWAGLLRHHNPWRAPQHLNGPLV